MSDRAVAEEVLATRASPGLFELVGPFARAVIEVSGRDAPRWLDGMVSNEVQSLAADAPRNGCYATLLTTKGRVLADLHVLSRESGYWLETAADAVSTVMTQLERYIVADDVTLTDRTLDFVRAAVEGAGATAWVARVCDVETADVLADAWVTGRVAGTSLALARFGWSGEEAWQLFVPREAWPAVREALVSGGAAARSLEALEVLRVEAGVPRLGPELDEEVFPDEARLDSAISRTKGCYTGQEIVARLYSRGAVNHLLVGLRIEGGRAPSPDASLFADEKRTGEVTSACLSPSAGPIALGYVRREHAEPGTVLRCEDPAGELAATVAALPLVPRTAAS